MESYPLVIVHHRYRFETLDFSVRLYDAVDYARSRVVETAFTFDPGPVCANTPPDACPTRRTAEVRAWSAAIGDGRGRLRQPPGQSRISSRRTRCTARQMPKASSGIAAATIQSGFSPGHSDFSGLAR